MPYLILTIILCNKNHCSHFIDETTQGLRDKVPSPKITKLMSSGLGSKHYMLNAVGLQREIVQAKSSLSGACSPEKETHRYK